MEPSDVQFFGSPAEFRTWLAEHHSRREFLWVGYWKKGTGKESVTWPETVDEALCFGWIDGIRQRLSDEAYTIRFTPRRRGSTWSLRNLERYRQMERLEKVHPTGKKAFERRVEKSAPTYSYEQDLPDILPESFLVRIESDPAAWAVWKKRPPSFRKKVTHWVLSAKQDETRDRRMKKLIDDLSAGQV